MKLANQRKLDWERNKTQICQELVGKPVYDGTGQEGVEHIIGKILEAHWENGQIAYTAELEHGALMIETTEDVKRFSM
jgi:hypothetical protein